MSNRRDFLKNISLFTAGGLLAGKAGSVNAANAALGVVDEVHASKEIGLQIYSLSQELYKGDEAAIVFAAQFYSSIGFGKNLQQAFDQAKAALLLKGIAEEHTPVLYVRKGLLAQDNG